MELTGQCKEDFEKWYLQDSPLDDEYYVGFRLRSFYSKEEAMKYGIYIDFFDAYSIWMTIVDIKGNDDQLLLEVRINGSKDSPWMYRKEARARAIELANQTYNGKL